MSAPEEKLPPAAVRKKSLRLRIGIALVAALYFLAIFADLIAPYDYRTQSRREPSAPVSTIRFRDEAGFSFRPYIHPVRLTDALTMEYAEDTSRKYRVGFLVPGDRYDFFGLFSSDIRLFGIISDDPAEVPRLRLLGTDALGRDRFSRLLYAIRFSLLVSPAGMIIACLIGIAVGIVSGYASRTADAFLMGTADAMMSLPTLILILAARAAFPLELPPARAAFLLIMIFAVTGWAETARLARGLVRTMREREFVTAARAGGVTETRILVRHIVPNIARPLVTQATLILPSFLLAEAALSFLGVGLQEPVPSLGNMLAAAADLTQLRAHPFLLLSPAAAIFLFTLALRLVASRKDSDQ